MGILDDIALDEARRKPGRTATKSAVNQAIKDAAPGLRAVGQRVASAEERFIEFAMKTAKLSRKQAEKALAYMRKVKVVKLDAGVGQFTFKHGAFAEPDVLRRAAGLEEGTMGLIDEIALSEAKQGPQDVVRMFHRGMERELKDKLGDTPYRVVTNGIKSAEVHVGAEQAGPGVMTVKIDLKALTKSPPEYWAQLSSKTGKKWSETVKRESDKKWGPLIPASVLGEYAARAIRRHYKGRNESEDLDGDMVEDMMGKMTGFVPPPKVKSKSKGPKVGGTVTFVDPHSGKVKKLKVTKIDGTTIWAKGTRGSEYSIVMTPGGDPSNFLRWPQRRGSFPGDVRFKKGSFKFEDVDLVEGGIDKQGPGENKEGDTDVMPAEDGKWNVWQKKDGKWKKIAGPFDDGDTAKKAAQKIEKAKSEDLEEAKIGGMGKWGKSRKDIVKILDKGPAPDMSGAKAVASKLGDDITVEKKGKMLLLMNSRGNPVYGVGPNNVVWEYYQGLREHPVGFVADAKRAPVSNDEPNYPEFKGLPKEDPWFMAAKIDPKNPALPKHLQVESVDDLQEAARDSLTAFKKALKARDKEEVKYIVGRFKKVMGLSDDEIIKVAKKAGVSKEGLKKMLGHSPAAPGTMGRGPNEPINVRIARMKRNESVTMDSLAEELVGLSRTRLVTESSIEDVLNLGSFPRHVIGEGRARHAFGAPNIEMDLAAEPLDEAEKKGEKVTIYAKGALGIDKVEGYLTSLSAHIVNYLPKRGRRERAIMSYYAPWWMVVKGWGHPSPDSGWDEGSKKSSGSVSTMKGRYRSADPRWISDFIDGPGKNLKPLAVREVTGNLKTYGKVPMVQEENKQRPENDVFEVVARSMKRPAPPPDLFEHIEASVSAVAEDELAERKSKGDYGRGAGGRSSEMSWAKGPKPGKDDKKAANKGERRGKKAHIDAQMRGESADMDIISSMLGECRDL